MVISHPLHLDPIEVHAGQTITGSVTYTNTSSSAITIENIVIACRPPGGTHSGGPYDDLQPASPAATVQPGATITATASRPFTPADPTGQWYAYATYKDSSGVFHDGPNVPFTVAAPSESGSSFGIKVAGNTFIDLSGNVLQLQGENVTSLEINTPSMWDAYEATSLSTWQAISSAWQMNIIRLPLNEWAWRTNATSAGGKPYQSIVAAAVANITLAKMYVILDLHWAAPNDYNGGVANGQPGFLNTDNSPAFWSSVATTFKNNPAVMFELFNEPYADDSGSWDSTRLDLLKSGGSTFTLFVQVSGKNSPVDTMKTFGVAGHQQLVNAIRTTGATNAILYSCPVWDSAPSQSLAVMPMDPLNQLGATVHYAGGANEDYTNILLEFRPEPAGRAAGVG